MNGEAADAITIASIRIFKEIMKITIITIDYISVCLVEKEDLLITETS